MTEFTLANLASWLVQSVLLAVVASAAARLLPVHVPAFRYGWWRAVLLVCLALPLIQPWQPQGLAPLVSQAVEVAPLPSADTPASVDRVSVVRTPSPVRLSIEQLVSLAIAAGVAARLLWSGLGLIRLRRLRSAGVPADTLLAAHAGAIGRTFEADVRIVAGLRQPVTFGIRWPVVLLPESLTAMPRSIQRAVLAHELWHVRRHDWAWSLAEEVVRAAFWFNPAIWYLVGRVQLAREEVVDELSILETSSRRGYLEALLAFADEPFLHPAAPFARRRHLFSRMLLISREGAMSPGRIVYSAMGKAALMLAAGWYGAMAFPLTAASETPAPALVGPQIWREQQPPPPPPPPPPAPPAATQQTQPRDPRSDVPRATTTREQELQGGVKSDPNNATLWLELADLQEKRGAVADAEATLRAALDATQSRDVVRALAGLYNRQGQFEKTMAALEDAASRDAGDPSGHQLVAVYYWEKAQRDQRLSPEDKARYLQSGIAAADRAIALNPDYIEALTYKNIMLRMQANMDPDPARRQALIAEADTLRNRAMALNKARTTAQTVPPGAPPPPPPPPPPHYAELDGQVPLRVGGNIKTPTKIKDVKPVYPAEAMASNVSGMVIIEALIDARGDVRDARVLRSIPILDQAALDAVKQWKFTPTMLEGVAVPVIMTVTVNFTLQ